MSYGFLVRFLDVWVEGKEGFHMVQFVKLAVSMLSGSKDSSYFNTLIVCYKLHKQQCVLVRQTNSTFICYYLRAHYVYA